MSNELQLTAETRAEKGKGPNRRLKAQGFVPGVYYNAHGENILVKMSAINFTKVLTKAGYNKVVTLLIDRDGAVETKPCLIWDVKSHPFKPRYEHVDFLGIDPDREVTLTVPVVTTGKAKGVVKGGMLEWYRNTVDIVCLPKDIPDNITIDITLLDGGEKICVRDLPMPAGVQVIFDDNFAVLTIKAKGKASDEDGDQTAE
ncbi:MAG: 50S ribosomal protein L25 [Deltaproteobacteria bacterium]|nr:50S ribosomal protein L25 [Deltaproteobacteria bacterium]